MKKGKLYLIPSFLGDSGALDVFPQFNFQVVSYLHDFIVEEERSARRFLKKVNPAIDISLITFSFLNEHTSENEIFSLLDAARQGRDIGLISEAGMPCIADPGASLVSLAHSEGIRVLPLVGPSSIFMALAASGFNGQHFCFHGYLPIDKQARAKKIREIEQAARIGNQTQIFIETPYRNMAMFDALMQQCRPATRICIAADISLQDEMIITATVSEWKKMKPELAKRPAVFLLSV